MISLNNIYISSKNIKSFLLRDRTGPKLYYQCWVNLLDWGSAPVRSFSLIKLLWCEHGGYTRVLSALTIHLLLKSQRILFHENINLPQMLVSLFLCLFGLTNLGVLFLLVILWWWGSLTPIWVLKLGGAIVSPSFIHFAPNFTFLVANSGKIHFFSVFLTSTWFFTKKRKKWHFGMIFPTKMHQKRPFLNQNCFSKK